jgi:hypothetical protein
VAVPRSDGLCRPAGVTGPPGATSSPPTPLPRYAKETLP